MKYSIEKNHQGNLMLFSEGYEVSLGEPNEPELEFWARIQELEEENERLKEDKRNWMRAALQNY